jgi:hypothetical protein
MQHLARASGVPLSRPNGPMRAYIDGARAFHCPSLPSLGRVNAAGTFFQRRTRQGAPLSFGSDFAAKQTQSQRNSGMFHETENSPML